MPFRHWSVAVTLSLLLPACGASEQRSEVNPASSTPAADTVRPIGPVDTRIPPDSAAAARIPNELGRIPVMEYHLIGDKEGRYERSRERFHQDLEILYSRGYRPVTFSQILDRDLNLPRGLSPVVVVFDDASPCLLYTSPSPRD